MNAPAQEPRNERVTIAVTASEKRALQFLATVRETTEADIVRSRLRLHEIVAEYESALDRLRADSGKAPASEAAGAVVEVA